MEIPAIKKLTSYSDVNDTLVMLTEGVEEISQTTGITNRFREDKVDFKRILSQKEALSNGKLTHNGFFVVKAIFEE